MKIIPHNPYQDKVRDILNNYIGFPTNNMEFFESLKIIVKKELNRELLLKNNNLYIENYKIHILYDKYSRIRYIK